MNVAEAGKDLAKLVKKVVEEGISIDLERDDKIIARLIPAEPASPLSVGQLKTFLQRLPSLGDDSASFAADIRSIRAGFPAEVDPWD
jgi:antitoxin (DNA-binding transcriptional repressor) of toxin-antitoxin stability system